MKTNRASEIAQALQTEIFEGGFANGDRLNETALAQRFGVSRTPLREALKILATSGMVEQIPNRGVFIRQPGPVELLNMFEVMSELEAICGRLAAKRITTEALDQLHQVSEQCQQAKERNDPDDYYLHNETFHQIIYQQSGNAFLEQETLKLQQRLQPFRRMQLRYRGRLAQSLNEHETIVQALVDGDAPRAEAALRDHVTVQGDKFHQLISSLPK